jgi:hypothetical protein
VRRGCVSAAANCSAGWRRDRNREGDTCRDVRLSWWKREEKRREERVEKKSWKKELKILASVAVWWDNCCFAQEGNCCWWNWHTWTGMAVDFVSARKFFFHPFLITFLFIIFSFLFSFFALAINNSTCSGILWRLKELGEILMMRRWCKGWVVDGSDWIFVEIERDEDFFINYNKPCQI